MSLRLILERLSAVLDRSVVALVFRVLWIHAAGRLQIVERVVASGTDQNPLFGCGWLFALV